MPTIDGFGVVNRFLGLDYVPTQISVSGEYRVPAGVYRIFVEVLGAGGGGGASGVGSDGGYGADFVTVVPGQTFSVTIGAGGTSGGAGGTSSFSTLISASGGGASSDDWNPSHGTSSAKINKTGGGSRGGGYSAAGQDGKIIIWSPQL